VPCVSEYNDILAARRLDKPVGWFKLFEFTNQPTKIVFEGHLLRYEGMYGVYETALMVIAHDGKSLKFVHTRTSTFTQYRVWPFPHGYHPARDLIRRIQEEMTMRREDRAHRALMLYILSMDGPQEARPGESSDEFWAREHREASDRLRACANHPTVPECYIGP